MREFRWARFVVGFVVFIHSSTRPPMGRSTMIAALLGVPLASAFAVSGVTHSAFAPASGRLSLAPSHPACSTHARSVLASGAAPALRGARSGLLGASAVEYSVIKGEETKNGGHKYTFTVTVAGDMSKDSYGEQRSSVCACVCRRARRVRTSPGILTAAVHGVHAVTIMKDFKKNAQFPGFRKGTIPPFMLPKVKQFVILDCLEKTLSTAVKDEVACEHI